MFNSAIQLATEVINEAEAEVVRRIFREYLDGKSPRNIAQQLNRENIPGPSGAKWGASTIYGNRDRGIGVLNNYLYVGIMVWNRQKFIKNPETGKRVARLNPESEWIQKEVPEMRILDQDLWDAVKSKQGDIRKIRKAEGFWSVQRPKNLFSFLIKCGCCGGGFSKISKNRYGCSTARNKGACENRLTIRQDVLESSILEALQKHLMNQELCKVFCQEYTKHMQTLRLQHNAARRSLEVELQKLVVQIDKYIDAIGEGHFSPSLKEKMIVNEARQAEIKERLSQSKDFDILIHPTMAARYHQEIQSLIETLNDPHSRTKAANQLRPLIDKIVLTPDPNDEGLSVDLVGNLAGILHIALDKKTAPETRQFIHETMDNMQKT